VILRESPIHYVDPTAEDDLPLCRCGAQINARRDGIHEIDAVQVCERCWVEATLAHIDATAARILGQAGK
jgi:hypothetical protein